MSWVPEDEHLVMKNFERKCSHCLSDMPKNARISARKPNWINHMAWDSLHKYWSSDDFIRKSNKYKKNRADRKMGSLHIGGSISTLKHDHIS